MKVAFAPVGLAAGLLAGFLAQKGFQRIWAIVDDEEPPDPDDRDARFAKLVPVLLIEGAIFGLVKGMTSRGARSGFARLTGTWPGDEPSRP